jgi:hypothetical protein
VNPWLRWPLLVAVSPILVAVGAICFVGLVFLQIGTLVVAAVDNSPPENLFKEFWRDVIRG